MAYPRLGRLVVLGSVENASLMPWLAGTALFTAIVVEKRDARWKSWLSHRHPRLLAVAARARSWCARASLTSVHAFAQDPARGLFIWASGRSDRGGLAFTPGGRPLCGMAGCSSRSAAEGALILNNLLCARSLPRCCSARFIPLFLDLLTGAKVRSDRPSSTPPSFRSARHFVRRAACVGHTSLEARRAVACPDASRLVGRLGDGRDHPGCHRGRQPIFALAAIASGVWLIAGGLVELAQRLKLGTAPINESMRRLRATPRASLWHDDLACGAGPHRPGIRATAAWHSELIQTVKPGETLDFVGYQVAFSASGTVAGSELRRRAATRRHPGDGGLYTIPPA